MKAVVIVDGLNLYHALKALGVNHTNLDIRKASERLLSKEVEVLEVFYFTSPPEHLGGKAMKNFVAHICRLQQTGVIVIKGRFQRSATWCKTCGALTQVNKEKETDVSVALQIVESAAKSGASQILVYSADSDLTPALRLAKSLNPEVQLIIAQTGPYLRNSHPALMSYADSKVELKSHFIRNYQFALDTKK
jgi:uncharacterized LabA/DUF88 family protein